MKDDGSKARGTRHFGLHRLLELPLPAAYNVEAGRTTYTTDSSRPNDENLMSRLLPPSPSPSSATVKASRRLSRVSPSEFDRVLQGNDTAVLGAGRDESTLGKATSLGSELASSGEGTEEDDMREQGDDDDNIEATTGATLDQLSNGTNRRSIVPTSSTKPSSSSSAAARSSNSYKRRSMNRSLGTSSSQEMASLARRIKRASVREASDSEVEDEEEEETEGGGKSGRSTPVPVQLVQARRLEEVDEDDAENTPGRKSSSSTSGLRNSSGISSSTNEGITQRHPINRLSKSPSSTIRRNSPSSTRPRSSLLSNSSGPNVRDSMVSQGSYVHVPFPSLSGLGKEGGLEVSPSRGIGKKTTEGGEQKVSPIRKFVTFSSAQAYA